MTLDVTFTVPDKLRLKINRDKFQRNVGGRLATRLRKQWSRWLTGGGEVLYYPQTEVERQQGPLKVNGWIAKNVKYLPDIQEVAASNRVKTFLDSDGKSRRVSKRANSLYGIMRILISGKWNRRIRKERTITTKRGKTIKRGRWVQLRQVRPVLDIYGDRKPATLEAKQQYAEREVARQVARGEIQLLTELQGVYKTTRKGLQRSRR
jgi:hypothetical protein